MKKSLLPYGLIAMAVISTHAFAGDKERKDLLRVQKTTYMLIDLLVEEGKLTAEQAQSMKLEAEREAAEQFRIDVEEKPIDPDTVRVPYVPDFVQEDMSQRVREEMMEFVLAAVKEQAEEERWGVPGTWPEWVDKIKLSGDVRLRYEDTAFGDPGYDQNDPNESSLIEYSHVNVNAINQDRRFDTSDPNKRERYFLNVSDDYDSYTLRARLNLNANISKNWSAGLRLRAGARNKPISCCERLGQESQRLQTIMDIAYLSFESNLYRGVSWASVIGGRFSNPFASTNLLWDSDYTFEGLSSSFTFGFGDYKKNRGSSVYLTLGAFPVGDYNHRNQDDKWLNAAQLGMNFSAHEKLRIKLSAAQYDYKNIEGVANPADRTINDYTAPAYVTKGNTLFNIDGTSVFGDETTVIDDALFALASDYDVLNVLLEVEWTYFNPVDVTFFYDFVNNKAWDNDEAQRRIDSSLNQSSARVLAIGNVIEKRTKGYHYGVNVGHSNLTKRNDWQVSWAYKYLEADAVLDAYTDSAFHGGGTDAEGMIVKGGYGLGDRASVTLEYLDADEIDGLPLNVSNWRLAWQVAF